MSYQTAKPTENDKTAVIYTTMGKIHVRLFAKPMQKTAIITELFSTEL